MLEVGEEGKERKDGGESRDENVVVVKGIYMIKLLLCFPILAGESSGI
jgi:hypothetical protein